MLHVRDVHEVSCDVLLVVAELVGGHQRVDAVVDVCRDFQQQAAVVLAFRGVVDLRFDVVLLLQWLTLVVPLQVRLGVARHAERNAPVLVAHRFVQLQNDWAD